MHAFRSAGSFLTGLVLTGLVLASHALAGSAMAQDSWPDLVGTWVGTSRAIVMANGGHYTGSGQGEQPRFVSSELVVTFTQQDRGRYIGTITSAGHTEPKLMVVAEDRKTLRTTDNDGTSMGTILDANRFELCYGQNHPSVVSCVVFRRR